MAKEQQHNFSTYTETGGGLSNKDLKYGEWWVRHKLGLERALIVFLSLVCIIFWSYSLVIWGGYAIFGYVHDATVANRQAVEFINFENTRNITRPMPLVVNNVRIFRSGINTYDIVGTATNPNKRFAANATFLVTMPDGQEWRGSSVVLPGQESTVGVFGINTTAYPTAAQLVFEQADWSRADAHEIPDVTTYIANRQQFPVLDVSFSQPSIDAFPTISFRFANASAYSYWQAPFFVELLSAGNVVGVVPILEERLRTGDERDVFLQYFGDAISIDTVRLLPSIDFFDADNYIAPGQ